MPPPEDPPHDTHGSPVGEALVWSSRITAIGIAMFLPGVAGGWLDERLGLRVLGPAGFIIGFAAALYWLTRIAARPKD